MNASVYIESDEIAIVDAVGADCLEVRYQNGVSVVLHDGHLAAGQINNLLAIYQPDGSEWTVNVGPNGVRVDPVWWRCAVVDEETHVGADNTNMRIEKFHCNCRRIPTAVG